MSLLGSVLRYFVNSNSAKSTSSGAGPVDFDFGASPVGIGYRIGSALRYGSSSDAGSSSGFDSSYMDFYRELQDDAISAQLEADAQNRLFQQQSAAAANAFSASEAQKNRDWQEMMSNTAYQRSMADMKAAGLNPILAYSNGSASTPGGSSAAGVAAAGSSHSLNTDVLSSLVSNLVGSSARIASSTISSVGNLLSRLLPRLR